MLRVSDWGFAQGERMLAVGEWFEDPSRFLLASSGDANERAQLDSLLLPLRSCSAALKREVGPPPTKRLRVINKPLKRSCKSMESAARNYVRSVDNQDIGFLDAASADLEKSILHTDDVTTELQALTPSAEPPPPQAAPSPAPAPPPEPVPPPSVGFMSMSDSGCTSMEVLDAYFAATMQEDYGRASEIIGGPDCPRVTMGTRVVGPYGRETSEIGTTFDLYELPDGRRVFLSEDEVDHAPDAASFSAESLELLGLYRELLDFKGEPEFHLRCFAQGSPYREWLARVEALKDNIRLYGEIGIGAGDIAQLARDYCFSNGAETDYTRWLEAEMNVRWLRSS